MIKRLQVVRVDNDLVEKADLQVGNNIISRGVVAGRNDEKIIKNAVTINLSPTGEMTITPFQVAPCYVKSTGSSRWQLLKLGVTTQIKPGDVCSLLPDKCWFKIIAVPDIMEENNLLKRKAEESLNDESLDKKPRVEDAIDAMSHGESLNRPLNQDFHLTPDGQNKDRSSVPLEDIYSVSTPEGDNMATENQGSAALVEDHTERSLLSVTNLDDDANEIKEIHETVEEKSSAEIIGENPARQPASSASAASAATNRLIDLSSLRNKCAYGKRCYRKNERHKEEFSHPGDADYDIPDNRPECRYGISCYRKSEEHWKNFQHTIIRSPRSKALTQPTTSDIFLDDESAEESVDETDCDPTWSTTSSEVDWDDTESDWDDDKSEKNHKRKKGQL